MCAALSKLRLLAVLACTLVSGCFGPVSQFSDLNKDASPFARRPVQAMANEVGIGLPVVGVLAVQRLTAEETGLPEEIARDIEETFVDQLRAGKRDLTIKSGRDLRNVWREAHSLEGEQLDDTLRDLGVDFRVMPSARPFPEGIELSFKAYDIREGAGGKVIGASLPRRIRIKSPQFRAAPPQERNALAPAETQPTTAAAVLSATGQARIGPALNARQARVAARMMARGDVVQQALGVRRTFLAPAQTLGAAHWAMGVLGPFLPYAEVWHDEETEDPGLLRVRLEARVRRFDRSLAESVGASLDPETVRAGTPIRVLVSAQRDQFVGVFAWQGDGTLSRVVPKDDRASIEIKTGQAIHLPEGGETRIVGRVPPGEAQGLGALVVVFSVVPLDFRQFGEGAADSRFLDRLAQRDPKTIAVHVLPFVVRAAGE